MRRFDSRALRPPEPLPLPPQPDGRLPAVGLGWGGPLPARLARQPLACEAAWAWCAEPAPFSQATLLAGSDAAAAAWAQALALTLDGSLRLQALPRARGLAWRLRLLLAEVLRGGGGPPRPEAPWDAGWAAADTAGREQLARRFRPRRPTLVLAMLDDLGALGPVAAQLGQRLQGPGGAAAGPHSRPGLPVRWLWLGADARCASHGDAVLLERS